MTTSASLTPCPIGRRMGVGLAMMNMRPVLDPIWGVTYLSLPPERPRVVQRAVAAKNHPRDVAGKFVSFAEMRDAINSEYAMTQFDYDQAEDDELGSCHNCFGCADCDGDLPW